MHRHMYLTRASNSSALACPSSPTSPTSCASRPSLDPYLGCGWCHQTETCLARVQCPGGWLHTGDLCLYEVFFSLTLLISVLAVILLILILVFFIFYTNEVILQRFCRQRNKRQTQIPVLAVLEEEHGTFRSPVVASCCQGDSSYSGSTGGPRLRSPDLTYRSLYSCDWSQYSGMPSQYSGMPSQYSGVLSQSSALPSQSSALPSQPSDLPTQSRLEVTQLYSQVDKKVIELDSLQNNDVKEEIEDVLHVGTESEGALQVEGACQGNKDTVDETEVGPRWEELGSRTFTLEELLALQSPTEQEVENELPVEQLSENKLPEKQSSEEQLSEEQLQGMEPDYPYFCREGRYTVRRPLVSPSPSPGPCEEEPTTGLAREDQDLVLAKTHSTAKEDETRKT